MPSMKRSKVLPLRVWALADSFNDFDVCTGATGERETSLGEKVVLPLSETIYHQLFYDNEVPRPRYVRLWHDTHESQKVPRDLCRFLDPVHNSTVIQLDITAITDRRNSSGTRGCSINYFLPIAHSSGFVHDTQHTSPESDTAQPSKPTHYYVNVMFYSGTPPQERLHE